MTATAIRPQDPRAYLRSLEEWLPPRARILAARGDYRAERLLIVWRRYRAHRELADWREFVEGRKPFVDESAFREDRRNGV